MRTALIISRATLTPAGITLDWRCGPHSGLVTADTLDLLAAQVAGLIRRLLFLSPDEPPPDDGEELEVVIEEAGPSGPAAGPAEELGDSIDRAFSDWEADEPTAVMLAPPPARGA